MGQPPYDPADLLKLYLYGYINQVAVIAVAGAGSVPQFGTNLAVGLPFQIAANALVLIDGFIASGFIPHLLTASGGIARGDLRRIDG